MLVPGAGLGVPPAAVHTAVPPVAEHRRDGGAGLGSDRQAAPVCLSPASRPCSFLLGDSAAFVLGFSPWKRS